MDVIGHSFLLQRTQTAPMSTTGGGFGGAGGPNRAFSKESQPANMSNNSSNMTMKQQHHSSLAQSQAHTSSNYSIQSQPSSRSSDTTQGTAHSTLFPPPPLPSNASAVAAGGGIPGQQPNGGNDVTATDNVMNTVADASSGIFQICVSLRERLRGVPGFSESLVEEEEDADEDTDPVTLLWRTFRRGYPLMLLYNALRPNQPLTLPAGVREDKRGKAATFKFLQACITDLKFPQEECFIITDLYGDDTTGFVKVARVVNRVLDILVSRGLVEDIRPTASDFEQAEKGMKRTQRQHIISELVTTERTYVQHLELLQKFKHMVEERGVIPGDAVHDIFLNLNALLDFQRRFLIRVEQTNHLPEEEQNWGKLFVLYCEAFKVYEPYIANQRRCERVVVAEFPKLAGALANTTPEMRSICESSTTLYGFLMKPFQRLSKYPLLLDDLYKKGDLDEARREDLLIGKQAATSVLDRTNKAVDREEKAGAVQELKTRVEDWKGHRVEGFGELLLYGTFTVLKSEGSGGRDGERSYHVYLFETILLCCKDIDLSKPKNKLSNKQLVDKRGKPKLQLKGRIFMQNVTDLISLAKPGSYTCQIFWKGDPSIENFIIRFTTEDMMKKWAQQIEAQRRKYRDRERYAQQRGSDGSRSLGTSATEFEFMRNQPAMENPYARDVDDDEESDDVETVMHGSVGPGYPYGPGREFGHSSRNGSSSSLRSRSTTGESMMAPPITTSRAPPPRFAPGTIQQPNLSLRTRELQQQYGQAQSPADYPPAESYFSPTGESPSALSSSRTSASSGMYSFARSAGGPMANGYYDETPQMPGGHPPQGANSARFTAPAVARQREPSAGAPPNGYTVPARNPGPRPGMHSAAQIPGGAHRNRSASSPDIHNQVRGPGGTGAMAQPPVPNVPAPYQQNVPGVIPRSQSNSPSIQGMVNGTPSMPPGATQRMSPQMVRERQGSRQMQMGDPSPTATYAAGGGYKYPQNSRTVTPTPNRGDSGGYQAPQQQPQMPQMQSAAGSHMSIIGPSAGSPPPSNATMATTLEAPTQLKVKVHCPSASQTLTLVVPLNISYQSLKDRIDAKLQRSTNFTLGGPKETQVKLKYLDEEDFVSIQSDEDVQTAFETWKEQNPMAPGTLGTMGEIELFCQR